MTSLEQRQKKAREIALNPTKFKICEGCESIVLKKTLLCEICKTYRFDNNPQHIVDQAISMGRKAQVL